MILFGGWVGFWCLLVVFLIFLRLSWAWVGVEKDRFGWLLIWLSIVWTIWKFQNDVLFSEGTFYVECLVDKVNFYLGSGF
jgi:hypothetical protein